MPALSVDQVQVVAYGPADIEAAEGMRRLSPKADGEVGFALDVGEVADWPRAARAAAVTFRLEADAPWNIREGLRGSYTYTSTAERRHVVISRDAAAPAVIYTAAPAGHRFAVKSAAWCVDLAACSSPVSATGEGGAVTIEPYGPAEVTAAGDGFKLDSDADAEIGFRIGLSNGVSWPRGADSAAVRFRLESESPWSVSEASGQTRD